MKYQEICIQYLCTPETFRPVPCGAVRWLDREDDWLLLRTMEVPGVEPPSQEEWQEWHREGNRFCALMVDGEIRSWCGIWSCCDDAWELIAVWTQEAYRGRGYARIVGSFAAAYVLENGRKATCSTRESNYAMQRVAEALGFRETGRELTTLESPDG